MIDPMKKYLEIMNEDVINEDIIDDILNSFDEENPICDELGSVIEQLESYFETEGSEEYKEGVYDGLQIAVNILNVIKDRYSNS